MSDYTPDKWLIVKLTNKEQKVHYRVFASWYGGYLGSDSWKLNSGITEVTLDENGCYHFVGSSRSVYHCHRNGHGISSYGHSVLCEMIHSSVAHGVTIETIPEETNPLTLVYE